MEQKTRQKTISNFVIEKTIGRGAFGKVYKGYEKLKKYPVAIKKIIRWDDSEIEKEISILKQLCHPNIVQLKSVEKTDKYYYIIMEYCEDGDLAKLIKNKFPEGKMPECQVQRLFQHVIRGLYAMHKSNIVHRDLKPENILVGENFMPKISDFGISRLVDKESFRTFCGTSIYIAPEIMRAQESYDEKCDIWSLGIMLYQVLLGTFPYTVPKSQIFDPLLKEIDETNPFEKENVQSLSKPLLNLLKSMLTPDPKKRIGYSELICDRWVTGFNLYPSIKLEHPSFSPLKKIVVTLIGANQNWVDRFSPQEEKWYYRRLQEKELIIDYCAQSQPIYQQNSVTVYHGFDCNNKREIAIKILKDSSQSHTKNTLSREYRMLSKLDHPNIIKCYGSYQDSNGNVYLFYEWCSNGNLESFINKNFPKGLVPEDQAQKIAKQLFAAMKALKEKSLQHQDLQLKNILVNESFNLKLAGFNSVYEEEEIKEIDIEKRKEFIATTAPEVLEKRIFNDKCEIWSLGVILYQTLTGGFPFKSPLWGPEYILKQVKQKSWLQIPENVSLPVKNILSAMLKVDIAKRSNFEALFKNPWISKTSKIVILGDPGVGKSCLASVFKAMRYKSTQNVEEIMLESAERNGLFLVTIPEDRAEDLITQMTIVDTGGHEYERPICRGSYHDANGALLCFDLTARLENNDIEIYKKHVLKHIGSKCFILLVGTKSDSKNVVAETRQTLEIYSKTNEIPFIETSSKTGLNIQETFKKTMTSITALVTQKCWL